MIQNIWCVGRNYADHAKELGNAVPSEPLFFLKAGSAITQGETLALPEWIKDLHYELEIAFQFGNDRRFSHIGLALDLTERTLQSQLKAKGQPWTLAKSFQGSCPVSALLPLSGSPDSLNGSSEWALQLKVNGELRQDGKSSQMLFSPEILREFALRHFPVVPGDLLLTGTPAGVGPLHPGDRLDGELFSDGKSLLRIAWKRP